LDAKADAVYTLTKATGNTSSASIANTTVDLVWNTPTIAGDGVTVSGSGVTLDDAGTYKFTVSFRADGGNSRNEGQLRTYLDTGAGYSELTNEIVTNYMSRITAQDEGTIMAIVALELDAGDKVKFSARSEADSTCTLIDAGTNLLVERVI